jgi:hypothetical protein
VQRKSRNQQDEVVPEVVSVLALAVAVVPPEDEERREAEVVSVVVLVVVLVVVVVPPEEDLADSLVEEVHHVVPHEVAVDSSHGHLGLSSSRVFSAWFGVREIPHEKSGYGTAGIGVCVCVCACLLSSDRACWL